MDLEPTRRLGLATAQANDPDPPQPTRSHYDPTLADCGCWWFPLMMTGRHFYSCRQLTTEFAATWAPGDKLLLLPARRGGDLEGVIVDARNPDLPQTRVALIHRARPIAKWVADAYLLDPPNVIL